MVNYFDDVIADVVNAVKRKGMWNNTLLVVHSEYVKMTVVPTKNLADANKFSYSTVMVARCILTELVAQTIIHCVEARQVKS